MDIKDRERGMEGVIRRWRVDDGQEVGTAAMDAESHVPVPR